MIFKYLFSFIFFITLPIWFLPVAIGFIAISRFLAFHESMWGKK